MSKTQSIPQQPDDTLTAEETYEKHKPYIDKLANEGGKMSEPAKVIRAIARGEDVND